MSNACDTPEYRLARADSKDPATTCRGIKADGQKCRRTVASAKSTPCASPSRGAMSRKRTDDRPTAALFCWQHKDQAAHITPTPAKASTPASKLKTRSSIETLAEKVGLLDVNDQRRPVSEGQVCGRTGPQRMGRERLDTEPRPGREAFQNNEIRRHSITATPARHNLQVESTALGSPGSSRRSKFQRKLIRFIMGAHDDEDILISKVCHRRTASNNETTTSHLLSRPAVVQPPFRSADTINDRYSRSSHLSEGRVSSQLEVPQPSTPHSRPLTRPSSLSPSPARPLRPSLQGSPASTHSHTDTLLSWIPNSLSPITTSTLLKELSEPISDADEPGYIYMCWVTPQTTNTSLPTPELASSLIPSLVDNGNSRSYSTSEIMRSAGITPNKVHDPQRNTATDTIILKIGRSSNVHRRMNQWKDQCAHNLTLMRYYPHVPSSTSVQSESLAPPRKVPHTHRVERLVHLELADRRVKLQEPCSCCGRKHKEWFEIRADREQLRIVDECVRRWVRWSEMTGG
ncbi:hypothetical protein PAAG_07333 [Paracoccidioides lutzii Pb01]|uniref:Bacteriophage T5 Orf172 DNA-binding domain-containing protein n=1 Tax=Paracoccidioides lutzii (strain ATCC MYA-826 / Pb01) TaxID=502779 RepID=C1H992_PARBA|nr:hypothetical protein PAAG_07333 [Paracoccidioides lutzii Pb01]EEH36915.1 hypothetical protein PAAG_07333 [Paracoccidioides lutzii Pb01]